jgi:hypothetical protein
LPASFFRQFQGLDAGLQLVGLLDLALQLQHTFEGVETLYSDRCPASVLGAFEYSFDY